MGKYAEVEFRGDTVGVVIDHDGGYVEDDNSRIIEWHFEDLALRFLVLTPEEHQSVYEQLAAHLQDEDCEGDL